MLYTAKGHFAQKFIKFTVQACMMAQALFSAWSALLKTNSLSKLEPLSFNKSTLEGSLILFLYVCTWTYIIYILLIYLYVCLYFTIFQFFHTYICKFKKHSSLYMLTTCGGIPFSQNQYVPKKLNFHSIYIYIYIEERILLNHTVPKLED